MSVPAGQPDEQAGAAQRGAPAGSRIDFVCPNCSHASAEYQPRCPACGLPTDAVFSGRYHPRRSRATRAVAWAILAVLALSLGVGLALMVWTLWGG
jgi:hypothetical protein